MRDAPLTLSLKMFWLAHSGSDAFSQYAIHWFGTSIIKLLGHRNRKDDSDLG